MTGTSLPGALVRLFRAASDEEHAARESARRAAFATTRLLIAGAHENGFLYSDLAVVLAVSSSSIRNRDAGDGRIPAPVFARLAGCTTDAIFRWHELGMLGPATIGSGLLGSSAEGYLASDLVRALVSAPTQIFRH